MRVAEITVESHRLGAELSIELGPTSMYQSLLDIQTTNGQTFQELIEASLANNETPFTSEEPTLAMLVTVRASGHQEHHTSAHSAIRKNEHPGVINHGDH